MDMIFKRTNKQASTGDYIRFFIDLWLLLPFILFGIAYMFF